MTSSRSGGPAQLADKVVVVTGATSGIGRRIAVDAAACGGRVMLVGRDRARLADAVSAAGGSPRATALELDITADEAPATLVEKTLATYDSLDAVVHSAGVLIAGDFDSSRLADFDRQWQVNVRAPYAITQAAIPHLLGHGSVVFITSNAAHMGLPGGTGYAATKGALEALSRTLAVEHGSDGVRFNCVAPGAVITPMNEHFRVESPEVEAEISDRTPLGRWAVPEDISGLVLYLLSEAASYVTGASFAVDGGVTAA